MSALTLLFLALAAFGHVAFWTAVVNRWHAVGFSRPVIKSVTLIFYAALLAPIAWAAWHVARLKLPSLDIRYWELAPLTVYLVLCAAYAIVHLATWVRWRFRDHPAAVAGGGTQVVDIARLLGSPPRRGARAALFGLVPGNELWRLHVSEWSIAIPSLARELAGLSICHWSDLHLCGRIDRDYFHEVVRLTNQAPHDLLALTGDICDAARYIDWIPELLGPVEARLGKYFILGNHDLRTHDVTRLRGAMREAGFKDLGGRALPIADNRIVIAGDERPWFKREPLLPEVAASDPKPLKILLAHTPDRLRWARAHDFDLMLAGHTHGGQICFPLIGPVLCPSWHGTKYASGFFHEPPTVMHVSRGTASLFPLRLGCPPEITRLVLRLAREPGSAS